MKPGRVKPSRQVKQLLLAPHQIPELGEEEQDSFWHYVDQKYFKEHPGAWEDNRDYGNSAMLNWSLARRLASRGHDVWTGGAEAEVMARTEGVLSDAHGLDWMVVDGRWLVDNWSKQYLGAPKAVYDLNNPEDAALVKRLYPPRDEWELAWASDLPQRPREASEMDWFAPGEEDWNEFFKP